ncbi:MAG: DUF3466 family protein [Phycisphaerales bacterium]|nr:DUF3466 family protein [Phycisphaerales bacterium]MCI0674813.1 DUF3466 family protein [Phycisphaerales bacterium]
MEGCLCKSRTRRVRRANRLLAAGAAALACRSAATAQVCNYEVVAVIQGPFCPIFGYPPTNASAISPNGRYVVGWYMSCLIGPDRAYLYDTETGEFFTIPHPQGVIGSTAEDVTDSGIVVGTARVGTKTLSVFRGFIYESAKDQWTEVPPLNPDQPSLGGWSSVTGINANGQCCGWRSIGTPGGDPVNPQTAFVYDTKSAAFTDLGLINGFSTGAADINEVGSVTGTMAVDSVAHAFLWEGGEILDLGTLAGLETVPSALNNSNEVVGGSRVPNDAPPPSGFSHAFIWTEGRMVDLGTLPDHVASSANAISDLGIIVGLSLLIPGQNTAVLWINGEIFDLNELANTAGTVSLHVAGKINSAGQVACSGQDIRGDLVGVLLNQVSRSIADLDGNCVVDFDDVLLLISEWHEPDSVADLNQDGTVDVPDLILLITEWPLN